MVYCIPTRGRTGRTVLLDTNIQVESREFSVVSNDICAGVWKNAFKVFKKEAVIHIVSANSMVVAEWYAERKQIPLQEMDFWMLKKTIPCMQYLPVLDNEDNLENLLTPFIGKPVVLVRNHGLFAWGDAIQTIHTVDALEVLFEFMVKSVKKP